MARIILGFSTCLCLAAPAFGQESADGETAFTDDGWEAALSLESDTSFERKATQDTVEDSIDVSDFKVAFTLETPPLLAGQGISISTGATYSPFAFDNSDRESSLFVETKIGGTYLEPAVFRGGVWNPREVGKLDDAIAASVSFRHSENYTEFFETDTGDAQTLSGNLEYRDLLLHYCMVEEVDNPGIRPDACEGKEITDAFGFAINAGVSRTWASDPVKENQQLKGKAKLLFPGSRHRFLCTATASGTMNRPRSACLIAKTGNTASKARST